MSKLIQKVSSWRGYLNNFPASVLLRVTEDEDGTWIWNTELYWEAQHAADNHLETGALWIGYSNNPNTYPSQSEANRFGELFLRLQGFQFEKGNPMKVYVIEEGEAYEGSSVIGVYSSQKKAIKILKKQNPRLKSYVVKGNKICWEDGGTFIDISEWEVQ